MLDPNIPLVARQAAEKAALIQTKYHQEGFDIFYKGAVNLLTQADVESQKAVVETIRSHFPTHQILAEEDDLGHESGFQGPLWIVDPIDGTSNYAHRFPIFSVSIGYVENGVSQFGLIHLPRLGEWFTAARGQGAFLNGQRIHVSDVSDLSTSFLATGFPYDRRSLKENNFDYFFHFEMNSISVRRPGAATFDLACVAAGRFDGYWELKLQPWDIAAGIVLVEEAGGKVTDLSGKPITDYWCEEILATNGRIHDRMVEDLMRIRAEKNLKP